MLLILTQELCERWPSPQFLPARLSLLFLNFFYTESQRQFFYILEHELSAGVTFFYQIHQSPNTPPSSVHAANTACLIVLEKSIAPQTIYLACRQMLFLTSSVISQIHLEHQNDIGVKQDQIRALLVSLGLISHTYHALRFLTLLSPKLN